MASGCVSTLDSGAKQRLQPTVQEGTCNYQEVNPSDEGPEVTVATGDGLVSAGVLPHGGDQRTKPRRKDTPVLNAPPHIPGARLLMGEKQTIFLEDDERNGKD
ncbi:unnamed protein product [Lota lota]